LLSVSTGHQHQSRATFINQLSDPLHQLVLLDSPFVIAGEWPTHLVTFEVRRALLSYGAACNYHT